MIIHRSAAGVAATLIGLMLLLAIWAQGQFPEGARIPMHFGMDGAPDRFGDAAVGVFFFPLIAAVSWAIFAVVPRFDSRRENLLRSARAYGVVWIAITALLAGLQGVSVAYALDGAFDIAHIVPMLLGALLVVIGNVLGKVRPNYLLGIRTPWTLADEDNWDKTHRFGGWMFVAGGLAIMLASALSGDNHALREVIIGVALLITLSPLLKSYLLWRNRKVG